jgi:hypothetical protein
MEQTISHARIILIVIFDNCKIETKRQGHYDPALW